jgi:hypothetical protein
MNWRTTRARAHAERERERERERKKRKEESFVFGEKNEEKKIDSACRGGWWCSGMGKRCVWSVEMMGQNGGLGNWMGLVRKRKEADARCLCCKEANQNRPQSRISKNSKEIKPPGARIRCLSTLEADFRNFIQFFYFFLFLSDFREREREKEWRRCVRDSVVRTAAFIGTLGTWDWVPHPRC